MHPVFLLGPLRLEAYGLCIVAGCAVGVLWLMRWRDHVARPEDTWPDFWRMLYALFLGGLVGGKLGFVVVEWDFFRETPRAFLDWRTGWVYWFSVLGTMAAGRLYQLYMNARVLKRPRAYLPIADYCVTAAALGHWLGRIGCFLNGCCHGRPTGLPWGVAFTSPAADLDPALLGVRLHPTQLYEAAGELALGLCLALLVLPRIRAKRWRQGTAFFLYLGGYSALRFLIETLRGDDRGGFLSSLLSPSQWVSVGGIAAAAWAIRRRGVKVADKRLESPYLDF